MTDYDVPLFVPELWLQSDSGSGWDDVARYDTEAEARAAAAYWQAAHPSFQFRAVRRTIIQVVLSAGPDRDRFCSWLLAALVDRVAELEEIAGAARELMAGLADEKMPLTELGVVLGRLADALGERRR